ncbi:multicopper oxidase domain-containing protein [Flavobacterium sp. MC2016-06]|uniref:multicopper oxidase domain-containing protein n=1 Tax=Flavobacterium sp. MC2016-06 TaxID=2676308 RepID=UPI0012BA933C|nr:multicopper oxidase domain-containing protein [Flavobacterium sp. MC2016-06]MBU3858272.1 multicopper oxidase domain-containing protein [Flavobacterium sp. MC2016-06]
MKACNKVKLVFSFLLVSTFLFSQNEKLIIGRTTGKLSVTKNVTIRTFGFTKSLSAQVTLPGSSIEAKEGENVSVDFWNISQGNPVSLYCKEIDFVQRDKENVIMQKKESIHHMEHGFYSFLAQKAGTYLYYSPENYPFNLQAGMFGVIIIRPKEDYSLAVKPSEMLWCSYEIDTKWHTDAIMGTEYDSSNKPIVIPKYKPAYFLVNGRTLPNSKGLQSIQHKKEAVFLRLVNSGLYVHEILFPANTKLQLISGKETSITAFSNGFKVSLHSGECLELLVSLENTADKEEIVYHFIEPISNQILYKAGIPVFY